jgi:hypothetical protein
LVERHWGAIERLADVLIDRGPLSGGEVDEVLRA